MNTTTHCMFRFASAATFVAIATAGTIGAGSPAFASPTRGEGEGNVGSVSDAPYAQPIDALGGLTLAQYVEQHQAGNPRIVVRV
jgi:hypothetical protein